MGRRSRAQPTALPAAIPALTDEETALAGAAAGCAGATCAMAGPTPARMLLNTTTRKEQITGNSFVSNHFSAGKPPRTGCPDSTGSRPAVAVLPSPIIPSPRKSTSSRPKRRTAPSSAAQWRDPCISLLPLCLPFSRSCLFAVACFCRHPERSEGSRYRQHYRNRSHLSIPDSHGPLSSQFAQRPFHADPVSVPPRSLSPAFPDPCLSCQAPKSPKSAKSPTTTHLSRHKENCRFTPPNSLQLNQSIKNETLLRVGKRAVPNSFRMNILAVTHLE